MVEDGKEGGKSGVGLWPDCKTAIWADAGCFTGVVLVERFNPLTARELAVSLYDPEQSKGYKLYTISICVDYKVPPE